MGLAKWVWDYATPIPHKVDINKFVFIKRAMHFTLTYSHSNTKLKSTRRVTFASVL